MDSSFAVSIAATAFNSHTEIPTGPKSSLPSSITTSQTTTTILDGPQNTSHATIISVSQSGSVAGSTLTSSARAVVRTPTNSPEPSPQIPTSYYTIFAIVSLAALLIIVVLITIVCCVCGKNRQLKKEGRLPARKSFPATLFSRRNTIITLVRDVELDLPERRELETVEKQHKPSEFRASNGHDTYSAYLLQNVVDSPKKIDRKPVPKLADSGGEGIRRAASQKSASACWKHTSLRTVARDVELEATDIAGQDTSNQAYRKQSIREDI